MNLDGAEHLTPSDAVWLATPAIRTGDLGLNETVATVRDYTAAFLYTNLRDYRLSPLLAKSATLRFGVTLTGQSDSRCGKALVDAGELNMAAGREGIPSARGERTGSSPQAGEGVFTMSANEP